MSKYKNITTRPIPIEVDGDSFSVAPHGIFSVKDCFDNSPMIVRGLKRNALKKIVEKKKKDIDDGEDKKEKETKKDKKADEVKGDKKKKKISKKKKDKKSKKDEEPKEEIKPKDDYKNVKSDGGELYAGIAFNELVEGKDKEKK